MIRVVVVDDHPLVRDSLTDVLESADGIIVVDQCADGSEVAGAVARAHPDVVLLDLQMPKMDGLTAARGVRATHPEVRIIFLTGGLSPASAHEARAIGAAGYLLKDDDPAELPGHVRTVAAGGTAWHPRATALLAGTHHADSPLRSALHYVEACPPHLRAWARGLPVPQPHGSPAPAGE